MRIGNITSQVNSSPVSPNDKIPARVQGSDFAKQVNVTQGGCTGKKSAVVKTDDNAANSIVKSVPKRTGTRLSVDAGTKRIIVSIIDETNKVIKQIPPERLLRIAARTKVMTALLFDEKG